ncbi:Uncharacterized protein Fot_24847 [Forsythia ovata]|uniref:Uncharacterized protein n=1 Tax=Forsythia ovata TaxID=205694 RepID=A0ABD1U7C1_9LAMI
MATVAAIGADVSSNGVSLIVRKIPTMKKLIVKTLSSIWFFNRLIRFSTGFFFGICRVKNSSSLIRGVFVFLRVFRSFSSYRLRHRSRYINTYTATGTVISLLLENMNP